MSKKSEIIRQIRNPTYSSNKENINNVFPGYPPQGNLLQKNYSIETEVCDHENDYHIYEVLSNEMNIEMWIQHVHIR